eukprot:1157218-Pelagomonas_calceolata.AAC.17
MHAAQESVSDVEVPIDFEQCDLLNCAQSQQGALSDRGVPALHDGCRCVVGCGCIVFKSGCTLASAIAAELSKGLPLVQAVDAASQYLHAALWKTASTCPGLFWAKCKQGRALIKKKSKEDGREKDTSRGRGCGEERKDVMKRGDVIPSDRVRQCLCKWNFCSSGTIQHVEHMMMLATKGSLLSTIACIHAPGSFQQRNVFAFSSWVAGAAEHSQRQIAAALNALPHKACPDMSHKIFAHSSQITRAAGRSEQEQHNTMACARA